MNSSDDSPLIIALERLALEGLAGENRLQAAGDPVGAEVQAAWRRGVRDAADLIRAAERESRKSVESQVFAQCNLHFLAP